MSEEISVLLVDDHGLVRRGFRRILEDDGMKVVGEASNGVEAIRLANELKPKVVVMDLSMPQLDGVQATKEIVKSLPETQVLILSMHSDETYLLRALNAGAKGYLLKDAAEVDLVRAVHSVSRGKPFFSPEITQALLEDYVRFLQQRNLQDSYELLTEREKEVLQLLAHGKSNKEVATALDLSTTTIESHRNSLMKKLNLHNTAEIVLYAVRKKIIA